MITYNQVKNAMSSPPTRDLVDLFNSLSIEISRHRSCINDENPFDRLMQELNSFCISATSIQSNYIAFVLGKNIKSTFPPDVIQMFYNIESCYKLQFGQIGGKQIDGCICLIHREAKNFNLQQVYEYIYK